MIHRRANSISKSRRGDDEPIQTQRDFDSPGGPGRSAGSQQPVDYFYHQDDLFNVVALTNASGTIIERITYGDYGFPTINDANGAFAASESIVGNPFLFTGREWDNEFRFYHYRTRSMDPMLGRFTTRDTIGVWGGRSARGNGMAFVASSPMVHNDPFGEDLWIEQTKAAKGKHRKVCVTLRDEACNAIGKKCIGFGPKPDVTGTHYFTKCPGIISNDNTETIKEVERRSQGCEKDRRDLEALESLEGLELPYAVCRYNCRDFARDIFNATEETPTTPERSQRERDDWEIIRHTRRLLPGKI